MSFAPSARGETECTAASKTSTVGTSAGGVAAPSTASATTVAAGAGSRPCGSPMHPSRTTVQRVNGTSSPPSPVPRGCSASSSSSAVTAPPPNATSSDGALPPLTRAAPPASAPGGIAGVPHPTYHSAFRAVAGFANNSGGGGTTNFNASSTPVTLPALTPPHQAEKLVTASDEGGSREASPRGLMKPTPSTPVTVKEQPSSSSAASSITLPPALPTTAEAAAPSYSPALGTAENSISRGNAASSRASGTGGANPYFRDNDVPHLFNELSEALLDARPENPVAFMRDWLRQRRDALN